MKEKILKDLVEKIKKEYKCKAIILYGSYADGTYIETSDLNIFCIAEVENMIIDTSFFNGIQLDLWICPMDCLNGYETLGKLNEGKILYEVDNLGTILLEKIKTHVEREFEISSKEKDRLKSWCYKMMSRIEVGDIEGNYKKIWLMNDLLPIYFQMKKRWYLGPKKSFALLKENDKKVYLMFEKLYSGNDEALKEIIEEIF
ncbi:MAG: nucleotidyltransferase domain-containing protein [Psychrilyobacter sp.]|uniref:nucleotidyltransferase domain-containing protein n=1 Tax=Psychrilyobacter sp. TaxID=2586924 RepID=UPI003C778BEF